jgi:ArsR family transcriptional regulator, virulence genes transcriptional regulator
MRSSSVLIADLEKRAGEAAELMRALANERRLLILCRLVEQGEASVGSLAEELGLSQPALSQQLAVLREDGIVGYRRDAQTLWYSVVDPRIKALLAALQATICGPKPKRKEDRR